MCSLKATFKASVFCASAFSYIIFLSREYYIFVFSSFQLFPEQGEPIIMKIAGFWLLWKTAFFKHNHGKYFFSYNPLGPQQLVWCSPVSGSWHHSAETALMKVTNEQTVEKFQFAFLLDLRAVFHMVGCNMFLDRMENWKGFPDAVLNWICGSFLFTRIYISPSKKRTD